MAFSVSFSQTSLAASIVASAAATYMALTPPNPSKPTVPSTGDSIRRFNLAGEYTTRLLLAPFGILALHAASLAYSAPAVPRYLLLHGSENGLNTNLITWSSATAVPLAVMLCAGVPLRLVSYASLGKNFTFTLAQPDDLRTTGIYRYVQHPSYTGLVLLMFSSVALLARIDGVLSCWISPAWYNTVSYLWWITAPVAFSICLFGLRTRVREEERMLKAQFGTRWAQWHASTARFIPGLF
ncbi:protein-S-isoprenylcysteine O-methyltransferase [Paramyrothecium foliicola]|nr:protein-S-isoprenylcysteine O-methyltransferase [Paramyrothecium foliicola]